MSPNRAAKPLKQPSCNLKRQESLPLIPTAVRTTGVEEQEPPPTSRYPDEIVPRCTELWFEDGDVIIWVQNEQDQLSFRVHRCVLKDSGAEPFCTVVDCEYPNPKTSEEMFLDGVWVIKYDGQDPEEVMYVIEWMYKRPSISKKSRISPPALKVYLERSEVYFVPAMRRCALEYLWNMFPTNLNYHQRVPCFVADCYFDDDPSLLYKPHVLLALVELAEQHKLIVIQPLLYYYIAQWPLDWLIHGVPISDLGLGLPSDHPPFRLPQDLAITILAAREDLIRMRQTNVFNFMKPFTTNGTSNDIPIKGCDGKKSKKTGETCFQWLMRVWFSMSEQGFISGPAALEIMTTGQWTELKKFCCEACAKAVMEHMLNGRDEVWDALPSLFEYQDWKDVVEQQKKVEADFEADIS